MKETYFYCTRHNANILSSRSETDPLIPMDEKQTFNNSYGMSNTENRTAKPSATDGLDIQNISNKTITKRLRRRRNKWTLIVTFLSLVLIIIFITIAYLVANVLLEKKAAGSGNTSCKQDKKCTMTIVETIPAVLHYDAGSPVNDEISKHWLQLIQLSTSKINILSFYWTMRSADVSGGPYAQAEIGEDVLKSLQAAASRGVKIRIVQNLPSKQFPQSDTAQLAKLQNIEVRSINMTRLMKAGIIHTKLLLVDDQHMYVGSANFDWRALTEIKELGSVLYNCSCSGQDLSKIFETNWMLAEEDSKIPSKWPLMYQTNFNQDTPLSVEILNNVPAKLYWTTSPPEFCPPKRTTDINAILDLIKKAKKFIYIAVMDYFAAVIYTNPKRFWPVIDNALREAAFNRGIQVYMLSSNWSHTNSQQVTFLKSLQVFGQMKYISNGTIQVKMFTIPPSVIPFTCVNHNKYMVTDNAALVGTSNWAGDYFISTSGVSLVVNQTDSITQSSEKTFQEQLQLVFLRDWTSKYAKTLS